MKSSLLYSLLLYSLLLYSLLLVLLGSWIFSVTGHEHGKEGLGHGEDGMGNDAEVLEELERKWGFEVCSFSLVFILLREDMRWGNLK
jgi:hypothetical protein